VLNCAQLVTDISALFSPPWLSDASLPEADIGGRVMKRRREEERSVTAKVSQARKREKGDVFLVDMCEIRVVLPTWLAFHILCRGLRRFSISSPMIGREAAPSKFDGGGVTPNLAVMHSEIGHS